MKFKLLLLTLSLFIVCGINSQSLKIHVDKKGYVGFVDENGTEVIKCQYSSATPFKNGISIVCKSGKYGCIDKTGAVTLPIKYSQISELNENLYLIKNGKKLGLADKSGIVIHEAKYSMISKFNCYGKAIIALGGTLTTYEKNKLMVNAKYGIIDKQGKIIVEPIHKGLYEFSFDGTSIMPYYEGKRLNYSYHYITDTLQTDCTYLGFSKNGMSIYGCGILDSIGNVVLNMGLYDQVMFPCSNMVRYYVANKKETICGYHDLNTGKSFVAAKFDKALESINFFTHGDFIGNIAPVNGDKWSFINKHGETLRSNYETLKHNEYTQLWAAKNVAGKWEVFDTGNNDIETLSGYDDIGLPEIEGDRKIFTVKKDGAYGCIDINGEVVIPFEYEEAGYNAYDVIFVKKDQKWGALSASNDTIIPNEFIDIIAPQTRDCKHFWVKKSDSLYYHYKCETGSVSSQGYKTATNFIDGIAHVQSVDMKVDDTPTNRAQLYFPNAAIDLIKSANIEEHKDVFGYLINTNDELIISVPISTAYKEKFIKGIKKYTHKQLSESDKKRILLEITKENRIYDLKTEIGAEEWNY